MKKILLLLLCFLLLCSCGKKNGGSPEESATGASAPDSESSSESASEADGGFDIYANDRAIAVMIDNDGPDSRPHAGLEDAYLIYEMYVEGKATRLMAVFKGTDTPKIGPVRSSRHYFLDYALDNDALYAHAGWSPLAMEQIPSMGVNNLNGLAHEPSYYWRERKYKGDYHSLYTSVKNLKTLAGTLGYSSASDSLPFTFSPGKVNSDKSGSPASELSFPYADFYKVTYKYNDETGMYDRYINSEYHSTQSGAKLSAMQIIVQEVPNRSLGDGTARQQLDTVGSGKGWLVTNEMKIPLTWERRSRTSKLRFYTEDGKEIELSSDGRTFVQVVPPSMSYIIE